MRLRVLRTLLVGAATASILVSVAAADSFNIPPGDLKSALDTYASQTGKELLYPTNAVKNVRTKGVSGTLSAEDALSRILKGTGFTTQRTSSGAIGIVGGAQSELEPSEALLPAMQLAQATPRAPAVETVTVTSSKLGGADVQSIPISITALSQEQLTATQTAGGPDLVKQVPNLTFTKTNFSGYSIQIRGIGTQAISVTTDPAVAVAMNDMPFIRNHFFEQEFYDVSQAEVLRGPQGTLYGRNSTAGVVNIITNKPTDQFEAMASADIGNYQNRRFEGMINLPVVDDRVDLRIAGEWTKRKGYSFNESTDSSIDGRDLWSGRVSLALRPIKHLQAYLVWEHFQEDDDRLRSAKQLCKTDYGPGGTPTNGVVNIGGVVKPVGPEALFFPGDYFTQGCAPESLYSPTSFEAPLGYTLPYVLALQTCCNGNNINPYASQTQSRDLRVINSGLNPTYRSKNDTFELNADYDVTPELTVTSQTGYNNDFLWSAEDYNRFGSVPGIFGYSGDGTNPDNSGVKPNPDGLGLTTTGATCIVGSQNCSGPYGVFCDPQLGCSDRLLLEDLSTERAWQLNQEFRMSSNFSGPLNFNVGANYLHYETVEKYYVFGNALTDINGGFFPNLYDSNTNIPLPNGLQFNDPARPVKVTGGYVDPNPITSLDDNGHNYFLSQNPYVLNSYAAFGEVNYSISSDFKLTGGLRWTDDQKHFVIMPSWLLDAGWGYPVIGTTDQQWSKVTGRAVANWTPKLNFTDQTLVYGSYSHGYKAGGANPPGALFSSQFQPATPDGGVQPNISVQPIHPLTFKPEFIDAFEAGTKNTLFDGALTFNADAFFYNYEGYQISEIVDRTAINRNFDAKVKGAEIETSWEPVPGLKLKFAGGYEDTRIDNGQYAVDLMDRTAGNPNWILIKPFVNEASNCIFPAYVAKYFVGGAPIAGGNSTSYCGLAYTLGLDPLTGLAYTPNPTVGGGLGFTIPAGYSGYDPKAGTPGNPYTGQNIDPVTGIDYGPAPNDGAGFSKNVGGNELPNAPHFTTSLSADYSMPVSEDWAATLHGDFYWQANSWWRVFNDKSYDRLNGYTNVNAALILTNSNGWQVIGYVKNIFDTTAITGAFLNSDDSGLTTNVFLTDPRLFGVRVTKNW